MFFSQMNASFSPAMNPSSELTESGIEEGLSIAVCFYGANNARGIDSDEREEQKSQNVLIHEVASSHRVLYSTGTLGR